MFFNPNINWKKTETNIGLLIETKRVFEIAYSKGWLLLRFEGKLIIGF